MEPKIGVVIHRNLRRKLFHPRDEARLEKLGKVVWTESEKSISVRDASQLLQGCIVGVGSWGTPHPNAELVSACPELRLWEHVAGTVKSMFGPHLKGRDLKIASCRAANAESVAEMTLAQIIIGLRRMIENAESNRVRFTPHPSNLKILFGSVIGIIGASEIGRMVIQLLKPFGCDILVYDPFLTEEGAKSIGVSLRKDLVQLCTESDVISLHAPWLPETEKMMNAACFKAMRDDAVFINTARGACVDEDALIEELKKGRLFAYLDVTYPEPPVLDSPFRKLPNVIYTSHIGGPATFRFGRQAVDDIEAFLRGGSPKLVVTEEMLGRIA